MHTRVSAFLLFAFQLAAAAQQQYLAQSDDAPAHLVPDDPIAQAVLSRALADGIDLPAYAFSGPALEEIVYWSHFNSSELPGSLVHSAEGVEAIDVHAHYAPKWYSNARQDSTEWHLQEHLELMANHSIAKSIFSVPNPNIFPGDKGATLAVARLLNENMAALSKALPDRFGFFATNPLPHVNASITEAQYALGSLGALGVALSSNHDGHYLGDRLFAPFFAAMDDHQSIIFLHPTEPLLEVNNTLIKANPTTHSPVLAEFYFETGDLSAASDDCSSDVGQPGQC
ncbi:hypothetical protein B0H16DRAFT_1784056 [Mycena metata]|uniref:Amidohydrolase-related domain-containing protein n=1 Tax=Mycena metata TaxID=1033252 RepID=A0AAD7KFD9_9AGAR|nr:hypothetical protein B0H16DRAFT_1784056 [Mycena metata]